MVAHTCNPVLGKLRREEPKLEASLGYSAADSCLNRGAGSVVVLSLVRTASLQTMARRLVSYERSALA